MEAPESSVRWEHFPHDADMGVRGIGNTKAQAFEQAALALMAIITDPQEITPEHEHHFNCEAPDDDLLLVEWLDSLIYEMACRREIFGRFHVTITDHRLEAVAYGEPVDRIRHEPAVEVKGATFTELAVRHTEGRGWVAQCVVDV